MSLGLNISKVTFEFLYRNAMNGPILTPPIDTLPSYLPTLTYLLLTYFSLCLPTCLPDKRHNYLLLFTYLPTILNYISATNVHTYMIICILVHWITYLEQEKALPGVHLLRELQELVHWQLVGGSKRQNHHVLQHF